jgi:hypothetical protein
MTTQEFDKMLMMPPQPDWPIPTVPEGMALVPFIWPGVFWPCQDADGDWTNEFWVYIQKGALGVQVSVPVTRITADENPKIMQLRVDEACAKLAAGGGVPVNYSIGQALPSPGEE